MNAITPEVTGQVPLTYSFRLRIDFITLIVFAGISTLYLNENLTLNHAIGFACIALGAFFIFKSPIG